MAYAPIYIQKKGGSAINTTVYGVYCSKFPFRLIGDAKELPNNDWKDENGDDEYIPSKLPIKAYTIEVDFSYKGSMNTAQTNIGNFIRFISGQDGTGSELMVYDDFVKIGRQKVRYDGCSDDATLFVRTPSEGDVVTFKVKFKVDDPVTNVTLSGSNLVTA